MTTRSGKAARSTARRSTVEGIRGAPLVLASIETGTTGSRAAREEDADVASQRQEEERRRLTDRLSCGRPAHRRKRSGRTSRARQGTTQRLPLERERPPASSACWVARHEDVPLDELSGHR